MKTKLNRRDFLKLAGLLPLTYYIPHYLIKPDHPIKNPNAQNVIIIVFDALSAMNMEIFGYSRETMPNLSKLADRATVYHNHFASGNFTTPGTASLLTGTYPWTNRGFVSGKPILDEFNTKNIFSLFDQYYRITYSHNPFVTTLQNQFAADLDQYKPRRELYLRSDKVISQLFEKDEDIALLSWVRSIKKKRGHAYSLFLSHIYQAISEGSPENLSEFFPRGIPFIGVDSYYLLEEAIDWTHSELLNIPQPFLGYFHYLPPHKPYFTRKEFVDVFKNDVFIFWEKPHPIKKNTTHYYPNKHNWYDEFILYADAEFYRFFNNLQESGLLENTWLILTSDHGEIFERGVQGHINELLHQPLVRIPLLIFEPGQQTRQDVHEATSAVDVLPTLLHLTGQEIPSWCEGEVLPPYRDSELTRDRSVFALEAKNNNQSSPITTGTGMIVKGGYKLMYYFGYDTLKENEAKYELYDLENDPEELYNLAKPKLNLTEDLLDELKAKIEEADKPYSD